MSRDMTKPTKWLCTQRRLRSAWASAQSYQSICCLHEESLGPWLPTERTVKTLIRLDGCPGWSESSLGTHSFCWFCHVVAHMWRMHYIQQNLIASFTYWWHYSNSGNTWIPMPRVERHTPVYPIFLINPFLLVIVGNGRTSHVQFSGRSYILSLQYESSVFELVYCHSIHNTRW